MSRGVSKLHMDTEKRLTEEHGLLFKEIGDMNRNVSKLHMDTEKRTIEEHRETKRRLNEINIDISRRLLILDKMEASLTELLIRTEPPEKKPFIIIRLFRRLRSAIKSIQIRMPGRKRK